MQQQYNGDEQGPNLLNNQAGGSCARSSAILSFLEDSVSSITIHEFAVPCLRSDPGCLRALRLLVLLMRED
jgi:hypothetical protein